MEELTPTFAGAHWRLALDSSSSESDNGGCTNLLFTVIVADGAAEQIAISLEFNAEAWSTDHFVVFSGGVYDGNRFLSKKAGYPPIAATTSPVGRDVPIVINDIPRLALETGEPSRISYDGRCGRTAIRSNAANRPRKWQHSPS